MPRIYIETPRLSLRDWTDSDLQPFADMNGDPRVMEHFPALLSHDESNRLAGRIQEHLKTKNWGLFAAESKETGAFIGFIGLAAPLFESHFTPCVEIGWRLAADSWGKGYATEGAKAVTHYAFDVLTLKEIVSFTTIANVRSRRVMEKIGMTYDCEFENPRLPPGHPQRKHVLYRLSAP